MHMMCIQRESPIRCQVFVNRTPKSCQRPQQHRHERPNAATTTSRFFIVCSVRVRAGLPRPREAKLHHHSASWRRLFFATSENLIPPQTDPGGPLCLGPVESEYRSYPLLESAQRSGVDPTSAHSHHLSRDNRHRTTRSPEPQSRGAVIRGFSPVDRLRKSRSTVSQERRCALNSTSPPMNPVGLPASGQKHHTVMLSSPLPGRSKISTSGAPVSSVR